MNCLACGANLPEGARFCIACGARVDQPAEIESLFIKMQASAEQKIWTEVIQTGEKLLQAQPEHGEARKLLIKAFLEPSLAGEATDVTVYLQRIDKALALDSTCIDAWMKKGVWSSYDYSPGVDDATRLNRALACMDRAIRELNSQIERNRQDAGLFVQRGKVYVQRGASLARENKNFPVQIDYDLALADFEQAIGLAPENPEAYFERGTFFLTARREGELEIALTDFSMALDLQIENPGHALAQRGATYLALGRLQEAAEDIEQAISAGETSAYEIRGDIALQRGDWRSALRDYSLYIARDLNGDWDEGIFTLKKALNYMLEMGLNDEALSTASSIAPNLKHDGSLQFWLVMIRPLIIADILNKGRDGIFSSPWFGLLLRSSKRSKYFQHADILYKIKNENYKLYLDWLNEMAAYDSAWALEKRANEYKSASDYRSAAEDYRRALDLVEEDSDLYKGLAECYKEMGNYEAQVEICSVALERISDEIERATLLSERAEGYRQLKENNRAIDDLSAAIQLAPTHRGLVYWFKHRGNIYEQMGDPDAAAADYERALRLVEPDRDWLRESLEESLKEIKESR